VAIGHNVSDLVALKAVAAAARALNVPGLELPRASAISFGVREIAAVVAALREETGQPIFLNADHTHSLEHALEAAKAGYDMIGFDVSTSPLEKNIELTQEAVKAVKSISPRIWSRESSVSSAAARRSTKAYLRARVF
jgi:fructose-bisphosphate aldolase, class II